jgi:hypothetical protein
MQQQFRKATTTEIPQIWIILQQAIARRKAMEATNGKMVIPIQK